MKDCESYNRYCDKIEWSFHVAGLSEIRSLVESDLLIVDTSVRSEENYDEFIFSDAMN